MVNNDKTIGIDVGIMAQASLEVDKEIEEENSRGKK